MSGVMMSAIECSSMLPVGISIYRIYGMVQHCLNVEKTGKTFGNYCG